MSEAHGYAINTYAYTLTHSAQDCLARLAEGGCRSFEVMMYPEHAWPADMDRAARGRFKAFLADRGLRVITLNMPNVDINLAAATREMRQHSLAILEETVRLAGDLEVPGVVIGPGKANPLLPAPKERLTGYFFRALDILIPLAEEAGTELWIENMPFAFLPEADALMTALERYGDERLGIVYDLANGAFVGEDLGGGLRRVKDRLKLVHLSDTPLDVYRHAPVGQGVVPFADVVPVLQEIAYAGPPMLEIISSSPDIDLPASMTALEAMGWDRIARPD